MNEIEEKFYKTFGIKQRYFEHFHGDGYDYPPITDRILLELICILSQGTVIQIDDVKEYKHLRNNTLACCIDFVEAKELNVNRKNQIKHQVQSLFTEGEE